MYCERGARRKILSESSFSDIFMLRSTPTAARVALNLETNKPLKRLMDCTDLATRDANTYAYKGSRFSPGTKSE